MHCGHESVLRPRPRLCDRDPRGRRRCPPDPDGVRRDDPGDDHEGLERRRRVDRGRLHRRPALDRPPHGHAAAPGRRESLSPSVRQGVLLAFGRALRDREGRQSGENSTRKEPCGSGTVHERCRPVSRRVEGRSFRFFRSRRNTISFRPATLPGARTRCPTESTAMRAVRPALRDAGGRIAEAALARGVGQTAFASSVVTTDLEGAETGQIVERVHWSLTFAPR